MRQSILLALLACPLSYVIAGNASAQEAPTLSTPQPLATQAPQTQEATPTYTAIVVDNATTATAIATSYPQPTPPPLYPQGSVNNGDDKKLLGRHEDKIDWFQMPLVDCSTASGENCQYAFDNNDYTYFHSNVDTSTGDKLVRSFTSDPDTSTYPQINYFRFLFEYDKDAQTAGAHCLNQLIINGYDRYDNVSELYAVDIADSWFIGEEFVYLPAYRDTTHFVSYEVTWGHSYGSEVRIYSWEAYQYTCAGALGTPCTSTLNGGKSQAVDVKANLPTVTTDMAGALMASSLFFLLGFMFAPGYLRLAQFGVLALSILLALITGQTAWFVLYVLFQTFLALVGLFRTIMGQGSGSKQLG